MKNYYYLDSAEEVQGPFTLSDLDSMHKSGKITSATQVCEEGTQNWLPFYRVPRSVAPQQAPKAASSPAAANTALVNCSSCGRSVSRKAPACPNCGEPMNELNAKRPQETLGIIILLTPLVAALLIWSWIGSMTLLQNPGSTLSFLTIGTIIITGILVGVEANQLGIGAASDTDKKGRKNTGPVGWGAVTMLLWIVGYPAYLYYRSKYGAKNMVVGGIVVALVFLGVESFMNTAIEEQKSNVRRQIDRSSQEMERIQKDLQRELESIQNSYE